MKEKLKMPLQKNIFDWTCKIRIAESSTGSTSQPKVIGSTPKLSSREASAHRCSEQALQNKRKKWSFLYIHLCMQEIGKAIERNPCIRCSCVHLWCFEFYLDSCDFTLRHFKPSYRRDEKIMKNNGGEIECLKRNMLSLIISFY